MDLNVATINGMADGAEEQRREEMAMREHKDWIRCGKEEEEEEEEEEEGFGPNYPIYSCEVWALEFAVCLLFTYRKFWGFGG